MKKSNKPELKKIAENQQLEFFSAITDINHPIPFFDSKVSAGFPSPAEDYSENRLDINEILVQHPAATFFVRVKGNSMQDANINDGDILVVDRSLEPSNNSIVIGVIDGEFTVKRITKQNNELFLLPANPQYKAIKITDGMNFQVWGIVTFVIHKA